MNDHLDDTPPEEELEMAVEELTGRPIPGTPAERIEALTKRVVYLQNQLRELDAAGAREFTGANKVAKDLAGAQRQLKEWKAQHEGRN